MIFELGRLGQLTTHSFSGYVLRNPSQPVPTVGAVFSLVRTRVQRILLRWTEPKKARERGEPEMELQDGRVKEFKHFPFKGDHKDPDIKDLTYGDDKPS